MAVETIRPCVLYCIAVLLLVIHNGIYLFTRALIIYVVAVQIRFNQLFAQHVAGHLASQGNNVAIIGQTGALGRIDIVNVGRVCAFNLVGRQHYADARTAEQNTAVIFLRCHRFRYADCYVGIDDIIAAKIRNLVAQAFDKLHHFLLVCFRIGIAAHRNFHS